MAKHERKTEHKAGQFDVQDFGETGSLTGYLSTFGNIDQGGDIVAAGAFKKTLQENPVKPLLWHHDPSVPAKVVGSYTAKEDERGLYINADFLPDPDSQNVRTKVKALYDRGVKVGLSIGYQVIKHAIERIGGEAIRVLQELRLNEGSLTLFPMNELALVTGVKSDDIDVDSALREEPDPSTPAEEPQDDKGTPEAECLHLLDEALATAKAISNLMEAK